VPQPPDADDVAQRRSAGDDVINTIYDGAGSPNNRSTLLIMLPGATQKPQDFIAHGFVAALRERNLPVTVAIADAHAGYYLEHSVVQRLRADVLEPAQAQSYRATWLLGISLGGLGALLYAREHARDLAGVIVLAPYLGVAGLMAEVQRAGGLDAWRPDEIMPNDDERRVLAWLRTYCPSKCRLPIYLAYGEQDRFVQASVLLKQRLPSSRVVSMSGGHDWTTWRGLWLKLLDRGILNHPGAV
jgi:pimeloyl-ACP methyl ester carboxylesterase